jgi:hypothetical protein
MMYSDNFKAYARSVPNRLANNKALLHEIPRFLCGYTAMPIAQYEPILHYCNDDVIHSNASVDCTCYINNIQSVHFGVRSFSRKRHNSSPFAA